MKNGDYIVRENTRKYQGENEIKKIVLKQIQKEHDYKIYFLILL